MAMTVSPIITSSELPISTVDVVYASKMADVVYFLVPEPRAGEVYTLSLDLGSGAFPPLDVRFAMPEYRGKIMVAAALMRACVTETVQRGFTHFITDVFEDDPNTPHGFHKRVLGFQEVATHTHGELNCESRRITMLLDFKAAYASAVKKKGWLYKYIMAEWDESMKDKLSGDAAGPAPAP